MLHGATSRTFLFFVSFLVLLLAPVVAPCDESPEEISAVDGDSGVNVEVFLASAYVFRGYNVFQDLSQHDRHGVFSRLPQVLLEQSYRGRALVCSFWEYNGEQHTSC